ncbi:unannotated protein [freshwater metagenome]|uniref:Unannotated protein n=1 Tax=freshwater metagenome TaxID=449393 RepID=A0A6J7SKQ6_9ZZZZ|nr:SDR family oxidoreductase [Actinomycetota bacterium]MSW37738.1 SDR family oxidoreductase [Actinomycetota bacterium]
MDLGLMGKKAVITGASRGIGRAIAETLGGEGASVAICARHEDGLLSAATDMRARGITVHAQVLDVSDESAVAAFVDWAAGVLGGLDIVVSNVSAGASVDPQFWSVSFAADLMAFVRLVEAATPHLEKSDCASILAIASTSGFDALPPARANSYAAFKAAVIQHASSLGHSLPAKGIRVNTISPGPIFFEGGPWDLRMQSDPESTIAIRDRIPMGRFGSPTDVANLAAFLSSPAAAFLTATNMVVDGGFTSRIHF